MTTASQVIDASLKLLNVASSMSPATPDQQQEAFNVLVDMLAKWEQNGVDVDVYIPYEADEELDEPEWLTGCLKLLLAKNCAPYFQVEMSEQLKTLVEEAEGDLELHGVPQPESSARLPKGQGNKYGPGRYL